MRRIALLGLLGLAACQATPPPQYARLPADAFPTPALDPDRSAIFATSTAFASPQPLAGRPADAARAIANLEYLAATLPTNPRWTGMNPTVGIALAIGRSEARAALGIDPAAPAQPVIEGLYAASRALSSQDQAAAAGSLASAPFTAGGNATLMRLAALPPLPRANDAGALAAAEIWRMQTDGREGGAGGSGGGAHP